MTTPYLGKRALCYTLTAELEKVVIFNANRCIAHNQRIHIPYDFLRSTAHFNKTVIVFQIVSFLLLGVKFVFGLLWLKKTRISSGKEVSNEPFLAK